MYEENNYYTISKASNLIGVKSHVLRFWEKKFKLAKPNKIINGRRYYSSLDIKNLSFIKKLLYDEGFTIKGATNFINKNKNDNVEIKELQINKKILEIESLISQGKNFLTKHIN
ncbi:MerR family transcriptional regulator [Alphaproteobacteria bacterium]|jgi:DNA-binding transcriptional MerR regulator|nr:MerR family transcriptional regulator [Alphaproteobacteria bacterium]MDB2583718.1 MerR family transcriptional regulator [Alphaproteobacteria bacterium]MDC0969358.1 MerR family transcriptional regulator [Alphaproteobacteria bacterium]